jgi:hypothetical protein
MLAYLIILFAAISANSAPSHTSPAHVAKPAAMEEAVAEKRDHARTKRAEPSVASSRGMNRASFPGNRTRAVKARSSLSRTTSNARERSKFGMKGEGCSGSIATGVIVVKI